MRFRTTGLVALTIVFSMLSPLPAMAWSNGPNDGNGYGTHDWVIDEALDMVNAPWVVRDVALAASDDPDMVFVDVVNHLFRPTGGGRGGPQQVADRYYDMVTAYQAGNYNEASKQLGWLSHYFTDLAVVYHVDLKEGDATESDEHLDYELDVDSYHREQGNVSSWITSRTRLPITDIRQYTLDYAVGIRPTYASLRSAYKANGLTGTALTLTKQNLSAAVNGLADIIAMVPSGQGISGPGVVTATARKVYVSNNIGVAVYADCTNAAGKPVEGVRVEFRWPLRAGTLVETAITDAEGRATSWVELGNEVLGREIIVTTKVVSGGQVASDTAVIIPTDVIDYIKTAVSNYTPLQNTQVTAHVVCLNAAGKPIAGLPVTFIWTHPAGTVTGTATTDLFGVARHRRNIGASAAEQVVQVQAAVEAGNTIRNSYATFVPKPNPVPLPFTPQPVAGANRYATAAAIAGKAFPPGGATTVVIATGENFPDALGGAALAGAYNGPILLTLPRSLPTEAADAIKRLGATHAIILGGTGAVGTQVESGLRAAGITKIDRISGSNRYDTARKVAQAAARQANGGWDGTALVATGTNFPDALAGSSLAAARRWPIYLADPKGAPATLASQMKADGVKRVIILGGTGAVSAAYEGALRSAIADTTRLYGSNRYETGVKIAQYGVGSAGLVWDGTSVATGENYPDALAGGMLAAKKGSVIVLTTPKSLAPSTGSALGAAKTEIGTVYYLGGTGAVSQAVRDQISQTLK